MGEKLFIIMEFIAETINKFCPIDYNHQNKLGKTFLHSVCENVDIDTNILSHIPLNTIQDINGNTAKHLYANTIIKNQMSNSIDVWQMLGDVKIKNNDGKTPYDLLKDESDLIKSDIYDKFNIS